MQEKVIDLKSFPKGVTIYFKFKNIRNTFFILIKDENSSEVYYKRIYDKPQLTVNLPVHPEQICVYYDGADLENYIVRNICIYKIPYEFNQKILIKRPYPIGDIRIEPTAGLPHGSEARFLYHHGIIQYDADKFALMPQPTRKYILTHELGHYWYGRSIPEECPDNMRKHYYDMSLEDEKECDKFALYSCINEGYNFSNVTSGAMETLHTNGHYNLDRILAIHNEIKAMHKNLNL